VVTALYICCLLGFAKNGMMPFHHWLPGAMVAPTPVSALLHAVAVVKVGVFSTVRVMLRVSGWTAWTPEPRACPRRILSPSRFWWRRSLP
jgi:formate hydrogenlyase subunit 3/multisubunit Na+/H+ antiporter MnhD subunit